jgi:hypothetical protein
MRLGRLVHPRAGLRPRFGEGKVGRQAAPEGPGAPLTDSLAKAGPIEVGRRFRGAWVEAEWVQSGVRIAPHLRFRDGRENDWGT